MERTVRSSIRMLNGVPNRLEEDREVGGLLVEGALVLCTSTPVDPASEASPEAAATAAPPAEVAALPRTPATFSDGQ